MEPVSNWQDILLKAWSIRFIVLALLLEAAVQLLPYFGDLWWAPTVSVALAGLARLMKQRNLPPPPPVPPGPAVSPSPLVGGPP